MHAQGPFLIMIPAAAPCLHPCAVHLYQVTARVQGGKAGRPPLSGGRCLPWEKMKSNGGHRKERKKATKGELAAAGQKAVGGERDGWRFYLGVIWSISTGVHGVNTLLGIGL